MKPFLLATLCLLGLAVAGFGLKSLLEHPAEKSIPHEAASVRTEGAPADESAAASGDKLALEMPKKPGRTSPDAAAFSESAPSSSQPAGYPSAMAPAPQRTTTAARQPASSAPSMAAPRSSAPSANFQKSASPGAAAPASPGPGIIPTASASSGSPAAPGVIELEPGVPVPAALAPPQEALPPAAAAAQQQLADSFVQDVNTALSQPETAGNDAAASQAYYNSLNNSNEQYRALFGNDSYNNAGIQATMDAQTSQ